jgi:hypothetical protein
MTRNIFVFILTLCVVSPAVCQNKTYIFHKPTGGEDTLSAIFESDEHKVLIGREKKLKGSLREMSITSDGMVYKLLMRNGARVALFKNNIPVASFVKDSILVGGGLYFADEHGDFYKGQKQVLDFGFKVSHSEKYISFKIPGIPDPNTDVLILLSLQRGKKYMFDHTTGLIIVGVLAAGLGVAFAIVKGGSNDASAANQVP